MSIRPLCEELRKKAKKELNEDESRVAKDIQYIRNWINQTNYITARTDDQWILTFLRGCKFSLERTKEKLDMYYTMRTLLPEFFGNRDPLLPEIQEILKLGVFVPLPKNKSKDSPTLIMIRMGVYDPSKIEMANVVKTNFMIMDALLNEDDQCCIAGHTAVQDMSAISMAHFSPLVMKKATLVFQDAYPLRPKGAHIFNIPSFFDTLFAMIKPLLKEKLRKRLTVYTSNDLKDMYKAVPQELLPKEYGGEQGSINDIAAEWKKKVEGMRDWFLEDSKYGTNESLRPGKPKTSNELFGLEGSFRQLNVD